MRTEISVRFLTAAMIVAAASAWSLAQESRDADRKLSASSLDEAFGIVRLAVEEENIPGAIALVTLRGKIIREEAFGFCDVKHQTPMTTTTRCWIASITKPVTVAAAMKLVEDRQLALDDRIEKYLPEFAEQKDGEGKHHAVTIRQLMSHTSGIQANPPSRPNLFFAQEWLGRQLAEVPPLIAATPLQFEPGSRVRYSNAAPYVLGRIVELRSGKTLGEFVEQLIFKPASMKDTYFSVPPAQGSRVAVVYRDAPNERVEFCRYDPSWTVAMTMPDGGLFSYPREILKFMQLFVDDGGRVLSRETMNAMLTRQAPGWGLGFALEDDGLFHHFGSSGTSAWADPRTGVVGILFFQLQNPAKTDPIQARFRSAVRAAASGRQ